MNTEKLIPNRTLQGSTDPLLDAMLREANRVGFATLVSNPVVFFWDTRKDEQPERVKTGCSPKVVGDSLDF